MVRQKLLTPVMIVALVATGMTASAGATTAQAADSLSGKDFEDALHLYLTFEERFNTEQLETYVKELGVEDYYAELTEV
ncbi:hypothetical protein ACT4ML_17005 [Natrinema sp. LN54]|uniref:hypothetical protein n=1 Tax=Natrinema sp. LN54 TaxID=3458705 RepID=UPI0040357338